LGKENEAEKRVFTNKQKQPIFNRKNFSFGRLNHSFVQPRFRNTFQ
jgi:hypothetical protein